MTASILQQNFPSTRSPEMLFTLQQESPWRTFVEMINNATPGDISHYIVKIQQRLNAQSSHSGGAGVIECGYESSQIQTSLHYHQSRSTWTDFSAMRANAQNIPEQDLYTLFNLQALENSMREALWVGGADTTGEGLLGDGTTVTALGNDSGGASTWQTWSPDELRDLILAQINAQENSMRNLAYTTKVVMPVRLLNLLDARKTTTTLGTQNSIALGVLASVNYVRTTGSDGGSSSRPRIEWVADDFLEGRGSNGDDLMVFLAPELKQGSQDFDLIGGYRLQMQSNLAMVNAIPTPVSTTVQLAGNITTIDTYTQVSSGWAVRPEASRRITGPF